jgi:NodT family efflux transporter outer membrane factor (OMF) lipoprotein
MIAISNQNVKQFEALFRQARALVGLNRSGYFPVIGTSPAISTGLRGTTASTSTGPISTGGTSGSRTFQQYSLPFSVSWEPDFWGRVRLSVENEIANAQSSAADVENARLGIQAELAADYFLLRRLDMDQALYATTISAYERALKLTVDRFNGGVASKADVLQAQTQLASARSQAIDLTSQRAQLEHAIAVLTGQPPSDLSLGPGDIKGPPPPIPAGIPSQLLERRPDIASAERRVAAANAEIGLAQVAYYPTLTLTGTAGFNAAGITDWLTWPSRLFSLGPHLSQKLIDFGPPRAGVREFEAFYDSVVANYRQTVLTAFQEVEDNLAALRILAAEAAQQQEAVSAAEQSLQLEIERYKAGTVSYLDVITTQTIALTNERAAVSILQGRMTAAVNLIRALGGGWNASTLPSANDLRSAAGK